jgi:hypothetical protein
VIDGISVKERPEITEENIASLPGLNILKDLLIDNIMRNSLPSKATQSQDADGKDEKSGGYC